MNQNWKLLDEYQPKAPLFNSEYYVGWLSHWQRSFSRFDTTRIVQATDWMLKQNASFNMFMFYGGTNYGFSSGASLDQNMYYSPVITSYDYDAPLDESGDPTTKYFSIREIIGKYVDLPNITLPIREPKMDLGEIILRPITSILTKSGRKAMTTQTFKKSRPLSFERINQNAGLVLYETIIPIIKKDPSVLTVNELHDRAMIYVDQQLIGILSRENQIYSIPLSQSYGKKLQILVENQGRISDVSIADQKGILGNVTINGENLLNWNITGFSLENYKNMEKITNYMIYYNITEKVDLKTGPTLFYGEIIMQEKNLYDTYLETTGWGKVNFYLTELRTN